MKNFTDDEGHELLGRVMYAINMLVPHDAVEFTTQYMDTYNLYVIDVMCFSVDVKHLFRTHFEDTIYLFNNLRYRCCLCYNACTIPMHGIFKSYSIMLWLLPYCSIA